MVMKGQKRFITYDKRCFAAVQCGLRMFKHSHSGSSYSCYPSSSTPDIPTAQTSNSALNIKFYDDREDNDDGGGGGHDNQGIACMKGFVKQIKMVSILGGRKR